MKKFFIGLLVLAMFTAVGALTLFKPTQEVRGKSMPAPIPDHMSPEQEQAQEIALASSLVQAHTTGHDAEVFGISLIALGNYPSKIAACETGNCRQVQLYLWDTDTAVTAYVDLDSEEVLDVMVQPHMRPGINKRLYNLAIDIATNAPEVVEALGYKPAATNTLAIADAGLLDSNCAGTNLCVAATFPTTDGRVLWAIIDLTNQELAGVRLGEAEFTGDSVPFVPTGCPAPGTVSRDGWNLDYRTTNHDGLDVFNATYDGDAVFTSIKMAEWHADYGDWGYQDTTGCTSGGGGFLIHPYGDTEVLDLFDAEDNVVGFEVVQDFRMGNWGAGCNYRYEQRMRFYNDGRFQPVSAAYGKGCQTYTLYRPVLRIDMAVDGDANDYFARWDGNDWETVNTETYLTPYAEEGHGPHHMDGVGNSWKVGDTVTGKSYNIVQNVGQYENGRGDSPFWFVLNHHPNEGDGDLPVFSSGCCYDDHQQGPHFYINNENVYDENLVLWYVPHGQTVATAPDYYCWTLTGEPHPETYPCYMGPMFVPDEPTSISAGFNHNSHVVLGQTAYFTNTTTSDDPATYEWNFGDGSPIVTTEHASHTYTAVGSYTVILTATNTTTNEVDTFSATIEIGVPPTVSFTHVAGFVGEPTQFTTMVTGTTPVNYVWNFGDSTPPSTDPNPTHIYTNDGTYPATVTVSSPFGTDTASGTVTIYYQPQAAFSHNGPINLGESAIFTNNSIGSAPITYEWDFGDGSPVSTEEHPVHQYEAIGDYTVTLTITTPAGTDMVSNNIQVQELGEWPIAAFMAPTSAPVHSLVVVENMSASTPPVTYTWDFGDGSPLSHEYSPSHIYTVPGNYTISLTVEDAIGSDFASSSIEITNEEIAPTAVFTHSVPLQANQAINFTNLTYGTPPITYEWDFGDGSPIVTDTHPAHTYAVTGTYTVTLTATNAQGSNTAVMVLEVQAGPVLDNFAYLPIILRPALLLREQ